MKDLERKHDLALRLELFGEGETGGWSRGSVDFILSNTCNCNSYDVVDCDAERDELESFIIWDTT